MFDEVNANNTILIILVSAVVYLSYCIFRNGLKYSTYRDDDVFDEVYLINLDRRKDRLVKFMQCYNNSDMKTYSINKFSAIDGSKVDVDTVPMTELALLEMKQLETTGFRYKHYQLTKGAIGCYLSHVKIWENMLIHQHTTALIFEDDARPPPNFLRITKAYLKLIPQDWDIILLGKVCNECEDLGTYYKVNRFILLHTYLINTYAIEKIIKTGTLFPIGQQLDSYLSELSDILNIYAVKNDIVRQGGSRTDIQAPIIKSIKNYDRSTITLKSK